MDIKRVVVNKKIRFVQLSVLLASIAYLGFPKVSFAYLGESIVNMALGGLGGVVTLTVGIVAYIFTAVSGLLITWAANLVVMVAQYSDIINVPTVINGWIIIRDLCNMFFVLIFLVIAFATILRVENYSAKRMLPKLLIMAVLINFSRTIFGIMTDFSQIVMLTFISAFKDGSGWFIEVFRVQDILKISTNNFTSAINPSNPTTAGEAAANQWSTTLAIIMGMAASFVSLVIMMVLLGALVMRIVLLWIYTILSPFVFLGWGFPAISKYTNRVWEDFIKQLIAGPLLAFFLWLALTTAQPSSQGLYTNTFPNPSVDQRMCVGVGALFCAENSQKFIIVLGLLVGGLMVTQQVGGAAGSMAGKGMARIQKGQALAWAGTKGAADFLNRKQAVKTGFDLNPTRQLARIKAGFEQFEKKDFGAIQRKATENLRHGGFRGMTTGFTATDWTENYLKGFLGLKGIKMGLTAFDGRDKRRKLVEEAVSNKKKANNVIGRDTYNSKLADLQQRFNMEAANNNHEKADKINQSIEQLNKMEIVEQSEVNKVKGAYTNTYKELMREASKHKISDFKGTAEIRAAQAEAAKNVTSDSEDELVVQFNDALANNNTNLAAAIAKQLAKIGGMNALLGSMGYNARAGLSTNELAALKAEGKSEDEIKEFKGFNDFMRDVFGSRMGEQNMMALQNDIASSAEGGSHQYMVKTVNVNEAGEFYQVDKDDRERTIVGERRKMENEGNIRKHNRLAYGGENMYDEGNFEWSESGLTTFIDNWVLVAKEIDGKRFNRSAAAKITEPKALEKLRQALEQAKRAGVLTSNKFADGYDIDKFIDLMTEYAKGASGDNAETLHDIIKNTI